MHQTLLRMASTRLSVCADMAYKGVGELGISRKGEVITLRPVRPSWASLLELPMADADFLQQRPVVVGDEGTGEL